MRRSRLRFIPYALAAIWITWRVVRAAAGTPDLASAAPTEGTRVLARDGRVLGERPNAATGLRGHYTHLDEISPRLVAATLAGEDRRFYEHDGVDRVAVLRALLTDLGAGHVVAGGSTLTAQLVKRIDHAGPRTLLVKVVENARAQNLERTLSKDQILEAYLNGLDYGHGLAGPEAAARAYFGVSAAELSLAQAAFLAVLPRAPSALDPYRHVDRTAHRQRALLASMGAHGLATEADVARALAEPIVLAPRGGGPMLAPHLVLASARTDGDVKTSLDFDLQRDVEALVKDHLPRLHARSARSVAVVVLDARTSEVLAELGSADYFDAKAAGAVDLSRRPRQAGSTLKPFLYARAFAKGMSPMAVLADVPTEIGTTGAVYAPDNFDGAFAGPVSAREALAGSLNVPAVRIAKELGASDVVDVLRKAGLTIPGGAERYGLSIALGSVEVSPLALARAYAVLARGEVEGETASALVADALSDPLARVRGLHARGPFEFSYPVAVKTGTSTAYRDAWTVGFTRERVALVWVGNADGAPTDRLTGASGAGPLMFDVMKRAMRDVSGRAPLFDRAKLEEAEVCPLSGELPGDACPDRVTRLFARGGSPSHTCSMHVHGHVELPRAEFGRFLAARPEGGPGLDPHGLPWVLARASDADGADHAHAEEARVVLVKPAPRAVFRASDVHAEADVVEVAATPEGLPRGTTLDVLVDGAFSARLEAPRYAALVPMTRGIHDLEVRPRDPTVTARIGRAEIVVR